LIAPGASAWWVFAGGVSAALHVGKLAPALPALRDALGIGWVEAGFLLSLVQLAGMTLGLAIGLSAGRLGLKRAMVTGLLVLSVASMLGAQATDAGALMVLRAAEGLGLLLATVPAPGLLRRLVPPDRIAPMLGLWGAYMPLGTALALLLGPLVIGAVGWPLWWQVLGAATLFMALAIALAVPRDAHAAVAPAGAWRQQLRRTLGTRGPWWLALSFGVYSAQWLAVIGFLPTIYAGLGLPAAWSGPATALVAAANILGNVASGRLLQRGVPAPTLLRIGYGTMGLMAVLTFAPLLPTDATGSTLRLAAVAVFSAVGGLIPGSLFSLSVRLAPGEGAVSTTVGWVQQWSSFGQFMGPPAFAWVAGRSGGWHWSWLGTGLCMLLGLALSVGIAAELARRQPAPSSV
jgi:CP family cyanate transporter-like MFS transporter